MHTAPTTPSPIASFAEQLSETPAYVYDPAIVIDNHRRLKAALGTQLIVSLKANPDLNLLMRCAHAFTDGVEFASVGEFDLSMGRISAPKYVNNPSMDAAFLRGAIAARATVIVDGLDHAARIVKAKGARPLSPLVLRLNVAALLAHGGQPAGHADHFGMGLDTARIAIDRLQAAGCEIGGIHLFGGSGRFAERHLQVLDALPAALEVIEARVGAPLAFINLGGGFDADWATSGIDFAAYRRRLAAFSRYQLAHESGRAIFQNAGWFATRVNSVKRLNGTVYAVCDGGISQAFLLCQTERFRKQLQQPTVLPAPGRTAGDAERSDERILFVGSSCSGADVIGSLPAGSTLPQAGDLAVFDQCGAYTATYTPAHFLSAKAARAHLRS